MLKFLDFSFLHNYVLHIVSRRNQISGETKVLNILSYVLINLFNLYKLCFYLITKLSKGYKNTNFPAKKFCRAVE